MNTVFPLVVGNPQRHFNPLPPGEGGAARRVRDGLGDAKSHLAKRDHRP